VAPRAAVVRVEPETVRRLLLRATDLERPDHPRGVAGARSVLERLGCIQLDPIDRVGTNADLVVHARVDGARRGDWAATMPGAAFEHFAKERCLLPAAAFPQYRDQAVQTPWWRLTGRLKRLPAGVLEAVRDEVAARGPVTAADLSDHGRVDPLDWSGWTGTGKAGTMALEVLWTRCEVVVAGRNAHGHRIYDLPERALPDHHAAPADDFGAWGLRHRVAAAGLLRTATGPWWSMLQDVRASGRVEALEASGALVRVELPDSRRTWLTTPGLLAAAEAPLDPDDRLRILGPLDPLLWDRDLVRAVFGFDYVWEVYTPAAKRRWGYYVCPLLHRGELVGRIAARRAGAEIRVEQVWWEGRVRPRTAALAAALRRLTRMQPRRGPA
jgi:uncharacterized protein YcaQ